MSGSHKVARNVLAALATQVISWGLTLALLLVVPRYLGVVGTGKLSFAVSFVAIFGAFVPLGTSFAMVREIARDRSRTGEMLLAGLLLRLALGLVVLGLIAALLWAHTFFPWAHIYPPLTRVLVLVAGLVMLLSSLNEAVSCALQGQENITRQSIGVLVDKFLLSGLTLALVFIHAPLWTFAAVAGVTCCFSILVNLAAFRPLLPTLRLPQRSQIAHLARLGLPFMGWNVFQTLYGQIDPVILNTIGGDAVVGWYSVAFRLVGTTLFLPTAISTALLPTLSRLHNENPAEFKNLARRTLALVMLCAIPVALLLILLPDRIIGAIYPRSFANSIPVLRIGGIGVLFWYAGNILGATVIAADGQKKMLRVSLGAALVAIPSCIAGSWLGQHFWGNGAVGAIASDTLLEAGLVAAYIRLLPPETFDAASLSLVARLLAAALPVAACLWWLNSLGFGLWIAAPCLALYAALCWTLGCIQPSDMALARSALARKAGV